MIIDYERLATRFINKFEFVIHAELSKNVCPEWCEEIDHMHGSHFMVYIMDKLEHRDPFVFDFWGTLHDKKNDNRPSNYSILSALNFSIISDLMEDEMTEKIKEFSNRVKEFFSKEELKELERLMG